MPVNDDVRRFLRRHEREWKPLVDVKVHEAVRGFLNKHGKARKAGVESALESYATVLYTRVNRLAKSDGAHLLFSAQDPGAYALVKDFLLELDGDRRWHRIGLLFSGQARRALYDDFPGRYAEFPRGKQGLFADLLRYSKRHPIDCAVTTPSSVNGPESVIFAGGKSILGAKRLFSVCDWNGIVSNRLECPWSDSDPLDGILCNDVLTKDLIRIQRPELRSDMLHVCGTAIGSLRVDDPASFTANARNGLGLEDDEIACLYIGDVFHENDRTRFPRIDKLFVVKTLAVTAKALSQAARVECGKRYVLMLRPHPRDSDRDGWASAVAKIRLPKNLRILPAIPEEVPIQVARYAADAVMGIHSTENFLAPHIGRKSFILAYPGPGLSGDLLGGFFL